MSRVPLVTGGRRAGKTIAMERARYEFTRANPSGITAEFGPGGSVRIEKPITDADLVPELPAPEVTP